MSDIKNPTRVTSHEARGGVYIKSVESTPAARVTELWSERADYNGPEDRFEVEGVFLRTWESSEGEDRLPPALDRSYARQTEGRDQRELEGERIVFRPGARRVVVERRAKAFIRFEVEEK